MNEEQRRIHNDAEREFDLIWRSMDGTARDVPYQGRTVRTSPSGYEPFVLASQIDDVEVLRELLVMYATLARAYNDLYETE
jgi:hypothetical protein